MTVTTLLVWCIPDLRSGRKQSKFKLAQTKISFKSWVWLIDLSSANVLSIGTNTTKLVYRVCSIVWAWFWRISIRWKNQKDFWPKRGSCFGDCYLMTRPEWTLLNVTRWFDMIKLWIFGRGVLQGKLNWNGKRQTMGSELEQPVMKQLGSNKAWQKCVVLERCTYIMEDHAWF